MPRQTVTEASQAKKIKALDSTLVQLSRDISNLEKEVARLTAIAQAPSTPNLKEEIETLKTSLTHALSSEQEMRAYAQETQEEWERVEKALRDENLALKQELEEASSELKRVKETVEMGRGPSRSCVGSFKRGGD
jgi:predicted RNase H-like nuclease (RuvC/YqgF family)